jgi:PilZ domain
MKEIKESRRQHPRFSVDIQVSVSIADHELSARTRDISRAGLCLVSLEAIPREGDIAIELVLTFGEGGVSEPLHLFGKVVWCTALFGAFQIGVKFVQVSDEQARYLNMFIGFLDGSLSTDEGRHEEEDPVERLPDPDDPFSG